MPIASTDIADFLDAEHTGGTVHIDDFNGLDVATARELSFYVGDNPAALEDTDAGAVVCSGNLTPPQGTTLIFSNTPKADFCKAVAEFFCLGSTDTGVHPTATVEDGAVLDDNCTIGPGAYIAGCVQLSDGCVVQAGAVIGTEGYSFVPDEDGNLQHLPHKSGVVIGTDVRVGGNTVIDRGVFEATRIGQGTKIDSNVKIGHNAEVGENVRIATGTELSGSVTVEDDVYIHPQVAVASHVTVGDSAEIGIGSTVVEDVEATSKVVDPTRPRRIG